MCIWVSRLSTSATGKPIIQSEIFVNNRKAIKMAKSDDCGNSTKHIDLKYHVAHDLLNERMFYLTDCA